MKKTILATVPVFLFLFIFTNNAKAQVLINEFSSWNNSGDWVELFNIGNTPLDLTDYMIRDSTVTNKILLTGTIAPESFAVFDFSNRLNKDGDTIRLIKSENSGETLIDSVGYGGLDQVCAPGEGETVGRIPDGGNVLERFMEGTKNSSNSSVLHPCPTPTPDATPTIVPTTTSTPTPPHTLTPTKRPTPAISHTLTPSKQQAIISATPSAEESVTINNDRVSGSVLSDAKADQSSVNLDSSGLSETIADNNIKILAKKEIIPGLLIVTGIAAMLFALGSVIKKNKKKI